MSIKKTEAAVSPQPKPQIPTMLAALRRQRETARALVDALEAKLGPIMRPATSVAPVASDSVSDAAPVAQSLNESVAIFAALNARLRDITSRAEV